METTPSSTVGCAPSIHPGKSVPHLWCGRQWVGILVPAPAENLYQSSVKFLSHFRSPRPKSLCRSESFRNLYCLHSEGAKNENVLEYSSIWLYEKRNVLISNKRWRKRGHGHQNNFWGAGGGTCMSWHAWRSVMLVSHDTTFLFSFS